MIELGLSNEALEFIESYVSDDSPIDFSHIIEIRDEVREISSPCAERAIVRHDLDRKCVVINGVECERVTSRKSHQNRGVIVYLFGGGFIVGCPYSDLAIIGALAEWCQAEVIAPKYRLAPEYSAPTAANDCFAVWKDVAVMNTEPLFLVGESAGGNLAMVVAQRAQAEGIRIPDAIAMLSPAVDLRPDTELFSPTLNADPTLNQNILLEIMSTYGSNRDPFDPELSPLFGQLEGMPPCFITTGTRDMLLSMCLRLERQLRRAGVEVECRVWNGLWHVFEYYDGFPEAEESLREIASFLNSKVRSDNA